MKKKKSSYTPKHSKHETTATYRKSGKLYHAAQTLAKLTRANPTSQVHPRNRTESHAAQIVEATRGRVSTTGKSQFALGKAEFPLPRENFLKGSGGGKAAAQLIMQNKG